MLRSKKCGSTTNNFACCEGFKYINYCSRLQRNLDLALSITWHSYHSNIWGLTRCGSLYIQRYKFSWNTYYDQFELMLSVKVVGCTSGMERITSSNSAGATWNPLTWFFRLLRTSFLQHWAKIIRERSSRPPWSILWGGQRWRGCHRRHNNQCPRCATWNYFYLNLVSLVGLRSTGYKLVESSDFVVYRWSKLSKLLSACKSWQSRRSGLCPNAIVHLAAGNVLYANH